MKRYVCIHGHFYQPPRENPWLEKVETQDSAYPYHDWNRRITSDCYKPNAASRILDREGRIINIVNNYSMISYNFGPTILSWMEKNEPEVYARILAADIESAELFSGHGSAMAQCYNHMIMPLASRRDKRTQIMWGIGDFEKRYGRSPEGMWLPETAVDLETLDIMAESGIKFTILSQHQSARVRKKGEKEWHETESDPPVDPRRAYLLRLPSGREIAIFYYDMALSKAVAFEKLLDNGETFADRLLMGFGKNEEDETLLVNIATDGESYGHHHRHGEMALSYCMHHIRSNELADITNYGEFLEKHPPEWETEIVENSSWSCVHGIERWRSDCGCSTGGKDGWNQGWRGPLRQALDNLKERLDEIFEGELSVYDIDPWKVRNEYISVILDRSEENVLSFLGERFGMDLSEETRIKLLRLLEMERNGMLMFTSCGWFFAEVSGIETMQVMMFASRAIQLAEAVAGEDLESGFLEHMKEARSNLKRFENSAVIYERFVRPARLDLKRVCGHYAISSIFTDLPETFDLYFYGVTRKDLEVIPMGKRKLAVGRAFIRSGVTRDHGDYGFAVLHLGDHNIVGGVEEGMKFERMKYIIRDLKEAFERVDIPGVLRLIDTNFKDHDYSLWHLFRDEQREVFEELLRPDIEKAEVQFRARFDQYYPVVIVMNELGIPLPRHMKLVIEMVVNTDLVNILSEDILDRERLEEVVRIVEKSEPELDKKNLSLLAENRVKKEFEKLEEDPKNLDQLRSTVELLEVLRQLPVEMNFWEAQNILFGINREHFDNISSLLGDEDTEGRFARQWVPLFKKLASELGVKVS